MDSTLFSSFDRLERRLALMQQLAADLEQAQSSLLAHDLAKIEVHNQRQQELCDALLALSTDPGSIRSGGEATTRLSVPGSETDERTQSLFLELRELETQVGHLNQVHAALLRRARFSLAILARIVASAAVTYSPPQADPLEAASSMKR